MIRAEEKFLSAKEIASRVEPLRREGRKIVFTNGCFDLLHVGHLRYLFATRAEGDCLIVGVNSDESARKLKGAPRPILPAVQRMRVLAGLACVDFVTEFSEDTPIELIQLVRPDVLVKGSDYPPGEIVGKDVVESYGGRVITITVTEGQSTTAIIDRITTLRA